MDWLRISPAQVTLPGYAAVCDPCHYTMYRLTFGEAQAAAIAHVEEKHDLQPKANRTFSDLTERETGMTATDNQSIINELEALLRAKKDNPCPDHSYACVTEQRLCRGSGIITDPKLQAAWELITGYHPAQSIIRPRTVGIWLDGMTRGLLEQVVETIDPNNDRFQSQVNNAGGRMATAVGLWFRWGGDAQSLGRAIMEALNEPS